MEENYTAMAIPLGSYLLLKSISQLNIIPNSKQESTQLIKILIIPQAPNRSMFLYVQVHYLIL